MPARSIRGGAFLLLASLILSACSSADTQKRRHLERGDQYAAEKRDEFAESLGEVMFQYTRYVMYLAPLGVFAAIAVTVATKGVGILFGLGKLECFRACSMNPVLRRRRGMSR